MNDKIKFKNIEKIAFAVFFVFIYFFTYHPDIHETANHSFLFLESIFTGNVFDFYNYVQSKPLDLYYVNNAHYNILTYVVFGIWQLPIYIITKLFSLNINEMLLLYYTKALSVAFYVGCGYLIKKICEELNISKQASFIAALFFLFNPISFFSAVVMGQYDTLCLFFLLGAVYYYLKGDIKKFSILIGIGGVFKFFAYLIFIPLLLLKEKKIFNILKHLLLSLWIYIPTTILYFGRTGNASLFTKMMFERILSPTITTTFEPVSVFLLSFVFICVFCYFYSKEENIKTMSIYLSLVLFVMLFYGIYWHPQWLILLMPFFVITTFMQKNKVVYWYIDIAFCFGFFMSIFREFPLYFGTSVLSNSLIGKAMFQNVAGSEIVSLSSLVFSRIPFYDNIVPVILTAALFLNVIFKLPINNISLSDRITNLELYDKFSYKTVMYTIFFIGFICFWFVPVFLECLNSFKII